MAFPQTHSQRRAPRIKLESSIAASLQKQDGERTKGELQTISITGGLLHLRSALDQGDFVEVAFQTQSGKVQGLAEMLGPMQQPRNGVLQPFRFIALEDDAHRTLRMTVDLAADRDFMNFALPSMRKSL